MDGWRDGAGNTAHTSAEDEGGEKQQDHSLRRLTQDETLIWALKKHTRPGPSLKEEKRHQKESWMRKDHFILIWKHGTQNLRLPAYQSPLSNFLAWRPWWGHTQRKGGEKEHQHAHTVTRSGVSSFTSQRDRRESAEEIKEASIKSLGSGISPEQEIWSRMKPFSMMTEPWPLFKSRLCPLRQMTEGSPKCITSVHVLGFYLFLIEATEEEKCQWETIYSLALAWTPNHAHKADNEAIFPPWNKWEQYLW